MASTSRYLVEMMPVKGQNDHFRSNSLIDPNYFPNYFHLKALLILLFLMKRLIVSLSLYSITKAVFIKRQLSL